MSGKVRKEPSQQENTLKLLEFVQKGFAPASNYVKVRQDYPLDAVKFFLENLQLLDNNNVQSKILELGSGTGKFTRVMLEVLKYQNVRVIASDPVDQMCAHFKRLLPGVDIIQCVAEKISLPDESIDVVIAAQSFHWFANLTALYEIHRVLAPSGRFGMIWALPDISLPWLAEIWAFLDPLYKEQSVVLPFNEEWKNAFTVSPRKLFTNLEENLSYRLTLPSSFEDCYEFFASFSFIINSSESCKRSFRELFDEMKRTYFIDKGINLDHIPFKIYLYWCTKIAS